MLEIIAPVYFKGQRGGIHYLEALFEGKKAPLIVLDPWSLRQHVPKTKKKGRVKLRENLNSVHYFVILVYYYLYNCSIIVTNKPLGMKVM